MVDIKFNIVNQIISRADLVDVVAGSYNYLRAVFSFTPEWDGLIKTALFRDAADRVHMVLLDDDACMVPWEVIAIPKFSISVFAGTLITVNVAEVPVIRSGYLAGQTPPAPTEDIYLQVIAMMENQARDAQAAQAAETGAQSAESGAIAARSKAEQFAIAAESSADFAYNFQGIAETMANNAFNSAASAAQSASEVLNMTVSAETLPPGSLAEVIKTILNGVFNLNFKIPQGEKGDVNFAWLVLDPLTGILTQYTDKDYTGSTFAFTQQTGILYSIRSDS